MQCPRCKGTMTYEFFEDIQESLYFFYGWRCVQCGEVLDPLILSNRKTRRAPLGGRARKKYGVMGSAFQADLEEEEEWL